jgi:DNA-binding NarL/FixJ family response regulator
LPLPAARLALAHGTLLRQLDQPRAAIARLRDARTGFAALAARPFIVRCDEELIACGLPAPTGGSADPLELSADEIAVAHLVAAGRSNRETATQLYLSVKTVEYHLAKIYTKLAISSRRQLASRLNPATSPPGRP